MRRENRACNRGASKKKDPRRRRGWFRKRRAIEIGRHGQSSQRAEGALGEFRLTVGVWVASRSCDFAGVSLGENVAIEHVNCGRFRGANHEVLRLQVQDAHLRVLDRLQDDVVAHAWAIPYPGAGLLEFVPAPCRWKTRLARNFSVRYGFERSHGRGQEMRTCSLSMSPNAPCRGIWVRFVTSTPMALREPVAAK